MALWGSIVVKLVAFQQIFELMFGCCSYGKLPGFLVSFEHFYGGADVEFLTNFRRRIGQTVKRRTLPR